jgi:hypothetical protein
LQACAKESDEDTAKKIEAIAAAAAEDQRKQIEELRVQLQAARTEALEAAQVTASQTDLALRTNSHSEFTQDQHHHQTTAAVEAMHNAISLEIEEALAAEAVRWHAVIRAAEASLRTLSNVSASAGATDLLGLGDEAAVESQEHRSFQAGSVHVQAQLTSLSAMLGSGVASVGRSPTKDNDNSQGLASVTNEMQQVVRRQARQAAEDAGGLIAALVNAYQSLMVCIDEVLFRFGL